MAQPLVPSRPIAESLFSAARDLRSVESASDAREAARAATLALEFHLDTMARKLGGGAKAIDPGLNARARAVEERLRAALEKCWEFQRQALGTPYHPGEADALAKTLEKAATSEVDLVFAELNAVTAVD